MTVFLLILGFLTLWIILLLIASIKIIQAGEVGAVLRLGKFNRVIGPGLHFVIPLIEKAEVFSTQTHQHELPDEPENIDRVNAMPNIDMRLPFRIVQRGKKEGIFYVGKSPDPDSTKPEEWKTIRFKDLPQEDQEAMEGDAIHDPLTSEIAVVVEWQLESTDETSIKNFIENVSPEFGRDREEEVLKRIEDMTYRSLQEFLGPVTLGHATERLALFSTFIRRRIETLVGEGGQGPKPWGIHIRDTYIKSIYAGQRVNEARADAAAANSRKQATIRDAEAQKEATILAADAAYYTEKRTGEGKRDRLLAEAEALKSDEGKLIASLDMVERALPHANATYLPIPSIMESIFSMGKMFGGKGTPNP